MSQNPQSRRMRWWIPLTLLVLAGGTAAYLRSREIAFIEPVLVGIGLLTALLVGLWYIFFTGLPWRTRGLLVLTSAVFITAFCLGLKKLTRIEGSIGGSGIPRLVWKWSPKPEGPALPLTLQPNAASPQASGDDVALRGREFPQFLGPDRSGVLSSIPLKSDSA